MMTEKDVEDREKKKGEETGEKAAAWNGKQSKEDVELPT